MTFMKPWQPEHFFITIGGYTGYSYQLELSDRMLTYSRFEPFYENRQDKAFAPFKMQWERFWETLDTLKVWSWKGPYRDPNVLDGTSWKVELQAQGKQVCAEGSNAFPGDPDNDDFDQFLSAVSKLIDNEPFE